MIRLIAQDDTTALIALAEALDLFDPSEIEYLSQMLIDHFNDKAKAQDFWFTDYDNEPVSVAYVAPERMTEGTWNLYLIAVHPLHQRQGRGKLMLQYVEKMLTEKGERILLVETSGTDDFEYVRELYRKSGYEEEARIREFYAAGVDKIVFRKVLNGFELG
jgi:ribosomal protein S18 acetylase RimI-like enzyme